MKMTREELAAAVEEQYKKLKKEYDSYFYKFSPVHSMSTVSDAPSIITTGLSTPQYEDYKPLLRETAAFVILYEEYLARQPINKNDEQRDNLDFFLDDMDIKGYSAVEKQ